MKSLVKKLRAWSVHRAVMVFLPHVYKQSRIMDRLSRTSAGEIEHYRLQKLNALIRHFRTYPFYLQFLSDHGIPERPLKSLDEFSSFPIVTKSFITDNISYIAAQPSAHKINSTSGSTGVNFKFYQSRGMLTARSASVKLGYGWSGVEYWGDRKMVVWGHSPSHSKLEDAVIAVKQLLLNGRMLQGYGLDTAMSRDYLRLMHKDKPVVLEGYPSYIYKLAQVGTRENIKPFMPRAIITSGETLHHEQRELIEQYFTTKVTNRYGSREFGGIAYECRFHSGLHIAPFRFIVHEDANGELLVTDLDNYATPFIRYAIGDIGSVREINCPCGLTVDTLVSLSGRSHDIIRTRSGKILGGQFWTTASRAVGGIEAFQLVQYAVDSVELRIQTGADFKPENLKILEDKVHHIVGDELKLEIKYVDHIEPTKMGKLRFIINMMHERS